MKISLFTTLAVLLATAAAAPTTIAKRDPPGGKKVFAHYMVRLPLLSYLTPV